MVHLVLGQQHALIAQVLAQYVLHASTCTYIMTDSQHSACYSLQAGLGHTLLCH